MNKPKRPTITLQMLKPRIAVLGTPLEERKKTLKLRQAETGRTLALNGAAWRALRALVLSEQPLCTECGKLGLFVNATEVDHVDNDASNNERSNLVGLCKPHHSSKTMRHEHYIRTGKKLPVKGCDADGMPLDPDHPWNLGKITKT